MKDSYVFYIAQYEAIKDLNNEQLGRLFRALFEKQLGNEVVLEDDIKIAFNFINNQLVKDNKKYEEKVAKLTANAKKGGAPKGNQNARKQLNNQNNQIESDNVNVNVNVNNNVIKEKSNKRESTPPTLEEVQAYITDKRLNVNAQKFYDYYEATDWKDSKGNKVKSWKRQTASMEWLPKRR